MADLIETTESNYEQEVLKSETLCCVYFNAAWCKAGMELVDTVKAAADEVGDKMKFCEVDTDKQAQIVRSRAVVTIPTFQFVKAGETVDQLRGKVSKLDLLGKISAVLNEHATETEAPPTESDSPEAAAEEEAPAEEKPE